MKIHDGRDQNGDLVYFEVDNLVLSRAEACGLVARIPGAEIVKKPRTMLPRLRADDETFCVFRLGGKTFELWEPFGDNGRFHVAAAPPLAPSSELEAVRTAFAEYRPVWGMLRVGMMIAFLAWAAAYAACQFR